MDVFQLAAVAVVAAMLALVIKAQRPDLALLLSVITGVLIFGAVALAVLPVFQKLSQLLGQTALANRYFEVLLKALGISFVAQFAADICNDAGETALASKVETAGKVAVLIAGLPLIVELCDIAIALIGQ